MSKDMPLPRSSSSSRGTDFCSHVAAPKYPAINLVKGASLLQCCTTSNRI